MINTKHFYPLTTHTKYHLELHVIIYGYFVWHISPTINQISRQHPTRLFCMAFCSTMAATTGRHRRPFLPTYFSYKIPSRITRHFLYGILFNIILTLHFFFSFLLIPNFSIIHFPLSRLSIFRNLGKSNNQYLLFKVFPDYCFFPNFQRCRRRLSEA